GDPAMMDAYQSGDPYLAFAKQAGAVPAHATKHTHHAMREQFKACVLAVQYGMGPDALATRIGQPTIMGRELHFALAGTCEQQEPVQSTERVTQRLTRSPKRG